MKTLRIEILTTGEATTILAAIISVWDEVFETKNEDCITDYLHAFSKVLHPAVVDEASSLS